MKDSSKTERIPMPRISVLMPAYNALPYIREAVESVLGQDLQDWELVISDNGSIDGTHEYYDSLQDPRIRIFRQPENLGVYGNLNFLLPQARAPIAKLLCADDTLLPGALERVARFMEDRPDCAISRCWTLGDAAFFGPGGPGRVQGALPTRLRPASAVMAYATFGNPVGNLSQASCRPLKVMEAGGFNPQFTYAGDMEAWIRVGAKFGLYLQNEELVFERTHPQQNRVLLNGNYISFGQTNRTVELLAQLVSSQDLALLRRHWTVHFFSPRVTATVRELFRGQVKTVISMWRDLPPGISVAHCVLAYPHWKFDLPRAQKTVSGLMVRIEALNTEVPAA